MTITTSAAAHDGKRPFALGWVGSVVDEQITSIQREFTRWHGSTAVGTLARLRRGAGKRIEDVPELCDLTCEPLYSDDRPLPDHEIEPAEYAAHTALTLYALHQQSHRDMGMHQPGIDLGEAVRRLMPGSEIDERIRERFVKTRRAPLDALPVRLRELVTLLRGASPAIPLDYARLADQLYHAKRTGGLRAVRLQWGRGFQAYRHPSHERDDEGRPAA